jgi:ABC-type branched-subunit amino acid transport system substrate-binding protein
MNNREVVRVGLLLPFGSLPDEAHALYQAAELAVFEFGGPNTLLIPRESGATPQDAENATNALLRDGADIILGPVHREAVMGAAQAARAQNVPVIGFSSDREVAGDGVYILSMPLEEDVRRIADYAVSQRLRNIALLAPDNDYGRRVEAALRAELGARGGAIVAQEMYRRGEREAAEAAKGLARRLRGTNAQAILIAESGSVLRAIGPALLIGGVNPSVTRLLGTSAWAGGDVLREPTLAGGWYPAPDPAMRTAFEQRYRAVYGRAPSRIASLGYDAVMIAAELGRTPRGAGFSRSSLERADGFKGADGMIRFRRNGSIERGLSVLEVAPGGATVIDAAPQSLRGS